MAKPRIEEAIKNLVEAFIEHSNSDLKLNKEELMKMMEKEIQNPEVKVRNIFCYSYDVCFFISPLISCTFTFSFGY